MAQSAALVHPLLRVLIALVFFLGSAPALAQLPANETHLSERSNLRHALDLSGGVNLSDIGTAAIGYRALVSESLRIGLDLRWANSRAPAPLPTTAHTGSLRERLSFFARITSVDVALMWSWRQVCRI